MPKIGYDEAHARLMPGHLMLEQLLRIGTQEPTIVRLNMVSNAAWLAVWRPQRLRRWRVAIGVGSWAGPVQVAMLQAGEAAWAWLRRRLGRPAAGEPPVPTRASAPQRPLP